MWGDEKMDKAIRKQALFVLADDNEVMTAALDVVSGLGDENKEMNRRLSEGKI